MDGATPVYDLIDDLHYTYAGATTAEYNILNLPFSLSTNAGTRRFGYVYGGGKYSAQLIAGNPDIDETRHYLGGIEFKDGQPDTYNFGDGRVVFTNSVPRVQYRLHDHLGNTVVFFEDKNADGCIKTEGEATSEEDLEIIQRLLYYPFGMALEGLGAWSAEPWQQYRYNGKERDTLTGWYEYGFRWYIDGIGRFTGVDPLASKYFHISPFAYVANSPILHIDLKGDSIRIIHGLNKYTYVPGTGYSGNDSYISSVTERLEKIYNSGEAGKDVVGALVQSSNNFYFVNATPSSDNASASFDPFLGGGGIEWLPQGFNINDIIHESFHAYQHETGLTPLFTDAAEVGAFLFESVITNDLSRGLGADIHFSMPEAMSLLYDGFNFSKYSTVVKSFKDSEKNATGIYNNVKHIVPENPAIKKFLPLKF